MKKIKPNYFIIPFIVFLIATVGNYFTSLGLDSWYQELIKPDWTPSGFFIGLVWTFLYLLVTFVVLVFFNRYQKEKNFRIIIFLFLFNGLLNAFWSLLFFGLNQLFFAFAHINVLNLTIILLIYLLWPISKKLSLALLPYFIWVTIASTLNYFIWILN